MSKVPLPKEGCFQGTYPSTTLVEIPCTKAPDHPLIPARVGAHPDTVGGGGGSDFSSEVSQTISWAEGSFPSVSGVTRESAGQTGPTNTYSLQLNTNTFSTSLCSGATVPSNCVGWEQFVYEGTGGGFIQYWLINYGGNACPSGFGTTPLAPGDCYRNSVNSVSAPAEAITSLAETTVTGTAGGSDTLTVSEGNAVYMLSQSSILGLNTSWTTAEFNIFGDSGGDAAFFNTGSTIVVRTLTDSAPRTTTGPACEAASFTGETNNLNLVTNSCCAVGGTWPGIQFLESNASGTTAPACPTSLNPDGHTNT
ncbi:MAG TPA: hypothetical protein VK762_27560, partial [Polyangiaceae bacterium]|nr:hypothetical protein [Polyangiaceae bacterium]